MRWLEPLLAALAAIPDPLDDPFLTAAAHTDRAHAPRSGSAAERPACAGGIAAGPGAVAGPARVVLGTADAKTVLPGDIVIVRWFGPAYTPLLARAAGIVAERGSPRSSGAALARERGIPMVVGVPGATLLIRSGDQVALDGSTGRVRVLGAASH